MIRPYNNDHENEIQVFVIDCWNCNESIRTLTSLLLVIVISEFWAGVAEEEWLVSHLITYTEHCERVRLYMYVGNAELFRNHFIIVFDVTDTYILYITAI